MYQKLYYSATIRKNFEETVNLFNEAKNQGEKIDLEDLLHGAAKAGSFKVVKFLIDAGANIQTVSEKRNGEIPLHAVSRSGHLQIIEILIQAGSDVNARNTEDNTPLLLATLWEHRDVVKLLLASGTNIDSAPDSGRGQKSLLTMIQKLLCDEMVSIVQVGVDENNHPIYRQSDATNKPVKTYQEKQKSLIFKNKSSYLVAMSLFKTNMGIVDALSSSGIGMYLSKDDIRNVVSVSRVANKDGAMINSALLKKADDDSRLEIQKDLIKSFTSLKV